MYIITSYCCVITTVGDQDSVVGDITVQVYEEKSRPLVHDLHTVVVVLAGVHCACNLIIIIL